MKISKQTIDILRNFASIHESVFIKENEPIVSINRARNVIAVYEAEEKFPEFGIYQLGEFLSVINLFNIEETDFDFKEKYINIKYNRNKLKYILTDIDLIEYFQVAKPGDKYQSFNKFNSHFDLSDNDIQRIKKTSSILFSGTNQLNTNVTINASDGKGTLEIKDTDVRMSNNYTLNIENIEGDCSISFNVNYLVMLRGDYKLSILDKKLIKFTHKEIPLIYLITPKAI